MANKYLDLTGLSYLWGKIKAKITGDISAHNSNTSAHSDIRTALSGNATNLSNHTGNATVHITAAERTAWNALKLSAGLTADTTVYVSTSGNDTSGDGTSAKPYKTINKALSAVPTNLNGYTASINIAAGTYNEEVAVIDFLGGSIVFTGANGDSVTVTNMVISRAQVGINNIELTAGASGVTAVSLSRHGMLVANTRLRIPRGAWGVQAQTGSVAILNSGVTVNNSTGGAILAGSNASIFASDIAGSGNAVGISVNSGAVVAYGEKTIASTVDNTTSSGGRILSGSQTSIPNY